jgi:hypothetical protein
VEIRTVVLMRVTSGRTRGVILGETARGVMEVVIVRAVKVGEMVVVIKGRGRGVTGVVSITLQMSLVGVSVAGSLGMWPKNAGAAYLLGGRTESVIGVVKVGT